MDENEKWRRYQQIRIRREAAQRVSEAERAEAQQDSDLRRRVAAEQQDYNSSLRVFKRAHSCYTCGHPSVGPLVISGSKYDDELHRTEYSFKAVDWVMPADMNYCAYCFGQFHSTNCFECGRLCGVATPEDRICERDRDKVLAGQSVRKKRTGLREHAEAWLWAAGNPGKPLSYYFDFDPPDSYIDLGGFSDGIIRSLESRAIDNIEADRRRR